MTAPTIGRLNVRVKPDSQGFAQDLRRDLKAISQKVKLNVPVVLSKKSLVDLRKQLHELDDRTINVSAKMTAKTLAEVKKSIKTLDDTAVAVEPTVSAASKQRVARSLGSTTPNVGINVPRVSLERARQTITRTLGNISLPVKPSVSKPDLSKLKSSISGLDANIGVDVSRVGRSLAGFQLSTLTRPRIVPIIPQVSTAAARQAAAAIGAISGARAFTDLADSAFNVFTNIDRIASSAMKAGPALVTLGSVGVAGLADLTQTITTLGSGIASLAPLALLLPGMLGAGIATGVGFSKAISTAKENLDGFGESFEQVGDNIGDAAWDVAGENLVRAIERLLPVLDSGMTAIGSGVGEVIAKLSWTVSNNRGLRDLAGIFDNTATALSPLADAIAHATSGLLTITRVGTDYLPAMSAAAARLAYNFTNWAEAAAESGRMHQWIDGAISAARTFGQILRSIGGIMQGLARPMGVVGANPLTELAAGLERANQAISGPLAQGALREIFVGAADAMSLLAPALGNLLPALASMAPSLANIMRTSAVGIGWIVSALSELLSDASFQAGLENLFVGLARGLRALAPAIAGSGPLIGSFVHTLGTLATTIGTVLASAINSFGPVITNWLNIVRLLIPQMSALVVGLIETLASVLGGGLGRLDLGGSVGIVGDVLGSLVDGVRGVAPRLRSGLGTVADTVTDLGRALRRALPTVKDVAADLLDALGALLGGLGDLITDPRAYAGLESMFGGIADGVRALSPALVSLAPVIGSITRLAGDMAAVLGDVLGGALVTLSPQVATLVDSLATLVRDPALRVGISELFGGLAGAIGAIAPAIAQSGPLLGSFLSTLGVLASSLGGVVATALTEFGPHLVRFFEFLQPIIPDLARIISGAIGVLAAGFGGIVGFFERHAPQIGGAIGFIADMIERLHTSIDDGSLNLDGFRETLGQIAGFVGALAKNLLRVAENLGTAFVEGFQSAEPSLEGLKSLFGALAGFAADYYEDLALTAGVLAGSFVDGVDSASGSIGDMLTSLSPVIGELLAGVRDIGEYFAALAPVIGELGAATADLLGPLLVGIVEFLRGSVHGVVTFVGWVATVLTGIIEALTRLLSMDPSGAWDALKGIKGDLGSFTMDMLDTGAMGKIDVTDTLGEKYARAAADVRVEPAQSRGIPTQEEAAARRSVIINNYNPVAEEPSETLRKASGHLTGGQ